MLFQYPVEEAEILVAAFENCTLDKMDWSHEAHLLAGMKIYLENGKNAYEVMKSSVIRYNESVGTINDDNGGFHATITMFWIKTIANFCNDNNIKTFDQDAVDTILMSEELAERNSFLAFYSKELIMSVKARKEVVEGDL